MGGQRFQRRRRRRCRNCQYPHKSTDALTPPIHARVNSPANVCKSTNAKFRRHAKSAPPRTTTDTTKQTGKSEENSTAITATNAIASSFYSRHKQILETRTVRCNERHRPIRRNVTQDTSKDNDSNPASPCNAAARASPAQTHINPLKPKDVKQAARESAPARPDAGRAHRQNAAGHAAHSHPRPSIQPKHALR